MMLPCIIFAHAFLLTPNNAPRPLARSHQRTAMPAMADSFPASPKDIATEMSLAVRAALSDGKRRLDVTLPDGLCFGLFGVPPGKQVLGEPGPSDKATKQRADRELAFLFCEMFPNIPTAVVFRDESTADIAARDWAKSSLASMPRIVTDPSELGPKRQKAGGGFGSKAGKRGGGGASGSDGDAPPQIVLLVRPAKAELKALAPIVDPLGNEVVVVLLNAARLKSGGSRAGYEPTYSLLSNPHPDWRGGILYRPYPDQWHLGVAAKAGGPRIHGRSAERPSLADIDAGFAKVKDDASLVAGGALAAVGAAAALERVGEAPKTFAGEVAEEARKKAEADAAEGPKEVLPGQDKIRAFFGIDD